MEHFHWSLEDVKKLKVPQYFALIKILDAIEKKKPKKGKGKK